MTASDDDAEIRNLLAQVAHITDGRGTLDEYISLWTEDSVWESSVAGSWNGHEGHLARHKRFRRAGVQGPEVESFHVLTTVFVEVDRDEARSLSTWLLITRPGPDPKVQDVGTYTDTLRRTSSGWKLVTRKVVQGAGEWLREAEAASNVALPVHDEEGS
jgi:hypothetical protein